MLNERCKSNKSNPVPQIVYKETQIIVFKRNINIQERIGGYNILNGKVLIQQLNKEEGYCITCWLPPRRLE